MFRYSFRLYNCPTIVYKNTEENMQSITQSTLQKRKFMQNLTEMRLTSMKNGNSKMTLDEINTEINAVRKNKNYLLSKK